MIEGIGVDIVSNSRIKKLYKRFGEKFLKRIFTEREINYCLRHSNPIPHLAGRFAAKEAVIKALDKPEGLKLKDIEIINNQNGSPIVLIYGVKDKKIKITLSHEKNYTVAFVILESK
jgi:holo-[acyl-carrier protein] synthase